MDASGGTSRDGAADGLYATGAGEEGSHCEGADLESASENAGDMCHPEEEPCRYVMDEFGDG